MASQHEILRIVSASGPISRNKIGEFLGESSYRPFQTQLDRLTKAGFLQDTGGHIYILTDSGRETLTRDYAIKVSRGEGFSLAITETDLMMLDDKAFKEAWDLLGKFIRNRYPHPD